MTEFLRITKENSTKESIEEITELVEKEEIFQEERDSWEM